jgi:methylmalonyl-CoA mutase C-terminal domain/subunit
MSDVLVLVGGIIPDADVRVLKEAGVHKVFGPGSPMADIVGFVQDNAPKRTLRL